MYEQQHADSSTDDEIVEEDVALSNPLLKTTEETFCMQCSVSRDKNTRHICMSVNHVCATSVEQPNDKYPLTNGDGSLSTCERLHCHDAPKWHAPAEHRKLLTAILLCVVFMVAEIIGGYIAGSLAIMTDAVHLMSDIIAFVLSIFAVWLSHRSPTKKFTFGFYRAEILCALMSILLIWVITGFFIYLAIHRLLSGKYTIETHTMMLVAGIGIVVNAIMGFVLHGPCQNIRGMHGHTHSETHLSKHSINIRAAVIHVIGDLLQSIGVFVSAVIIHFYPGAKVADPICTFVFSILVLTTTVSIFRESVHILMEGFPKNSSYASILNTLSNIDGVQNVHELHLWSLTVEKAILTVHLAIDSSADPEKVLETATLKMRDKYSIRNVTIQIEKFHSETSASCLQCQPVQR